MPLPRKASPDEFLVPREVGQLIGRHPVVVIRYINEGRFPNAVVHNGNAGNGRRYSVPMSDVTNYLAANKAYAGAA